MTLQVERRGTHEASDHGETAAATTPSQAEPVARALSRAGALAARRMAAEGADGAAGAHRGALRQHARTGSGYAPSALDQSQSALPTGPGYGERVPGQAKDLLARAKTTRAEELQTLGNASTPSAADRVLPEDGSYVPEVLHVGVEPQIAGDFVMLKQLLEIGRIEGFYVAAHVSVVGKALIEKKLPPEARVNLQVIPQADFKGSARPWLEDYGEITASGGVRVPAQVGDVKLIIAAMQRGRDERMCPPAANACAATKFEGQGAVENDEGHEVMANLAASANRPLKQDLTYGEGGNRLIGTLPNGDGYALVGRDTLAISKAVLERDLGRAVSMEELLEANARDMGIKAENVIPVEQPGDFHLDMAIMLLHGGVAVLNDAREAAELTIAWRREDGGLDASAERAIRAKAETTATLEDRAEADMKSRGIIVLRVGGVFPDMKPAMNFLNVESGTGRGGRTFTIMLGGDPRAERHITERLATAPGGSERLYFLDPEITGPLLQSMGGLNCRVKGEGRVVETAAPPAAPSLHR